MKRETSKRRQNTGPTSRSTVTALSFSFLWRRLDLICDRFQAWHERSRH